jgi:hypothetical protein
MNTQITNLVEQAILDKMRAKAAFTALDVSNALKAARYPVRHGDVAAAVRDIYQSGAMAYYDYDRRLIDVVTEDGTKKARAFLYLHGDTREREYDKRNQKSLPLVPADHARDLSDCVAAGAAPVLPRPSTRPRRAASRIASGRRDGALPIPRALVERLGWSAGMALALACDGGQMKIAPRPPTPGESAVRVWGGCRLRVCKTKLRRGDLTADVATIEMTLDGGLRLRTKGD